MKTIFILLIALISGSLQAQKFDIFVSDAGNFNTPPWRILKFDPKGHNPQVFINTNLGWPQDILFLGDSVVLISNLSSGKITKHHTATGTYIGDFATGLAGPTRIKIGPDSLLYVLQWNGAGIIKRYNLNGTFVDDFTTTGVTQSIGLDWDAKGRLYVSSYNKDHVRRFDKNGNNLGIFINSNLAGPTNIWFDSNGHLLVSDYDGTAVKRFDTTGAFVSNFLTGLSKSEGVAVYPNGDILVGNGATSSVKHFDGSGNFIGDIITMGTANLKNPNAVVLRENPTFRINEAKSTKPQPLYPSAGREFLIDKSLLPKIDSSTVFNLKGEIISKSIVTDTVVWEASAVENGFYIIKLFWNDGSQSSQKVEVIH